MRNSILYILLALGASVVVHAQANDSVPDKVYLVSTQVGGGYAADLSHYTDEKGLDVNRNQFYTYAQLRWLPGNLLTGSLEVGYLNFYSVTSEHNNGKSVRSAVPVYLLFGMQPVQGLELQAGFGLGFLSSTVSGGSGQATSSAVSMATIGTISYLFPVADHLKIGAEGRFSYMDLYDDKTLGIGLVVRYQLFTY